MGLLLTILTNRFVVFVLVLTRVTGLAMVAPMWSSRSIPLRVRGLLALGLAVVVAPLSWDTPVADPGNLTELTLMLVNELAVGLLLGLAVMICFATLDLTGQIVGQMTGMSLADAAHPDYDSSVSVFAQLLYMMMLAIFLIGGGHRYMLQTFLDLLRELPPGHARLAPPMLDALTDLIGYSFRWGLQLAAPAMLTLLLTMLIMGLISRTMPQMNVLAVGFGINSMVVLGTLLLAIGVMASLFQDQSFLAIDRVHSVLVEQAPP